MNDNLQELYLEMHGGFNLHQRGLGHMNAERPYKKPSTDFVSSPEVMKALRNNLLPEWASTVLRNAVQSDHPEKYIKEAQDLIMLIQSHLALP